MKDIVAMETTDQYSVKALIHTLGLEAFYRDGVIIDGRRLIPASRMCFAKGRTWTRLRA